MKNATLLQPLLLVASVCLCCSPAAAQTYPYVSSFVLVRADTGSQLMVLPAGAATVNLAALPTRSISVRAVTSPSEVRSVQFRLNGAPTVEDFTNPYGLHGGDGAHYVPWAVAPGTHVISALPFDRRTGAGGTVGTLQLLVVDIPGATPTPTPQPTAQPTTEPTVQPTATAYPTGTPTVAPSPSATPASAALTGFSLVRSDTGAVLTELAPGAAEIDLAALPVRTINIRGNTQPDPLKKVEFYLNQVKVSSDSLSPYVLYPSTNNGYKPWTPLPGLYRIKAIPYHPVTGKPGTAAMLDLAIKDSSAPPATPSPTPRPTLTPTATATPPPPATQTPTQHSSLPVFPGAAGFGSTTVAGSGRHLSPPNSAVFRVTSLADSGAGSLRECVAAAGARVCVFEVSGRIQLLSDLRAANPFLTVAGQTAPAPGILLAGASLKVTGHDVLIQHLQVRPGDLPTGSNPTARDGVAVLAASGPVYNVVLDHLSISWALDENFSTGYTEVSDVTISNSVIAEALHASIHPDGPHSMGMLISENNKRVSIHHNLFAHNNDRNPRMKPGAQVEFISNFVYGWGGTSGWNVANLADTSRTNVAVLFNFIGNHYKPAPASPIVPSIYANPAAPGSRVYVLSNIGPTRPADEGNEWSISGLSEQYRALSPVFPLSDVLPHGAAEVPDYVLARAGCRPADGNSVDERIKAEAAGGTGGIKDCVSGCERSAGGYPLMEENQRPLELPVDPHGDADSDGYTNLEEYLHQAAAAVERFTL